MCVRVCGVLSQRDDRCETGSSVPSCVRLGQEGHLSLPGEASYTGGLCKPGSHGWLCASFDSPRLCVCGIVVLTVWYGGWLTVAQPTSCRS